MSKFKTAVKYTVTQEAKGNKLEMGNLYFKNVPVTFAQVLNPGKKYNSDDTAYQFNLFIDAETKDALDEIGLNKEMAEVGVTKIKKGSNRGQVKYKLDEHNSEYEGMFAAQFARNTVKRDDKGAIVKEYSPLKVVDAEGKPFTENVGNGSICNVRMFAYRNAEDMLVVMPDVMVVVEHVPYEEGGDYYDEELGITVSAETAKKDVKEAAGQSEDSPSSPQTDDNFDDDIPF